MQIFRVTQYLSSGTLCYMYHYGQSKWAWYETYNIGVLRTWAKYEACYCSINEKHRTIPQQQLLEALSMIRRVDGRTNLLDTAALHAASPRHVLSSFVVSSLASINSSPQCSSYPMPYNPEQITTRISTERVVRSQSAGCVRDHVRSPYPAAVRKHKVRLPARDAELS